MKTIAIHIFKGTLKFIYFFLKFFPTQQNKIVFISRQTDYIHIDFQMLKEEIERRDKGIKMIFMCKRIKKGIFNILKYGFTLIRQMYHLATSRMAIIDGYCIPVCILKHKKKLTVLQIWHSIGKIKMSGYQTLDTPSGRSSKMAKLMCMHKNYDKIIAGGPAFNDFYKEGFKVEEDVLLNYGLPRIDYLLQNKENAKKKMYEKFPELKGKKVVYYAPTFRTYDVDGPNRLIEKYNPQDFALILTCHPNQKLDIDESKIYKLNLNEFSAADILNICDYLITDYSSISLEAAVLGKRTLYYLYDYDQYMSTNGLNLDPKKSMSSCAFENPEPILDVIKHDTYDDKALTKFIKNYLPKELGKSTKLIVDYILETIKQ
ncbi:MAG: CDP-glycerol glycerophosphotransferase family protein [Bacilli bacterium]